MEFVYCRVGRGVPAPPSTDMDGLDVRWETNRKNAIAAGLKLGGYWRFFPGVDLGQQVVRFTDRLAGTSLPPMVDIEDQMPGWDASRLTDWAVEVLETVQEDAALFPALRVPPLLYSYRWFIGTHKVGDLDVPNALEIDRLWPRWPLGLAAVTDTWPDERATLWQYTGGTVVPWAAGKVDLDRMKET